MENYTDKELLRILKRKTKKIGTASRWAKELGVTRQYMSDILSGKRGIPEQLAKKVDEDIQPTEGWVVIPKHMRKKRPLTFREIMQGVSYKDEQL